MPTYLGNAYEILSQVRYGINEFSTALVNGTDTTGAFQNSELMRHINNAQFHIWSILFEQFPEVFLKNTSLTFTESEATLPSDCFKIREILNSDLEAIKPINIGERFSGNRFSYYRYGNKIRIDYATSMSGLFENDSTGDVQPSIDDTGSIWYYSRCRELDSGMTSAGGALSATLATTAKKIADYYNDMTIEDVTGDAVDTVSDYTAARVCTVGNTWAASRYYGLVSELPTIFHPLISEYAILQLKKNPKVPERVTAADATLFNEMLSSAMRSYAGTQNTDVSMDSIINDFYPSF
jgi:hypothetical protein